MELLRDIQTFLKIQRVSEPPEQHGMSLSFSLPDWVHKCQSWEFKPIADGAWKSWVLIEEKRISEYYPIRNSQPVTWVATLLSSSMPGSPRLYSPCPPLLASASPRTGESCCLPSLRVHDLWIQVSCPRFQGSNSSWACLSSGRLPGRMLLENWRAAKREGTVARSWKPSCSPTNGTLFASLHVAHTQPWHLMCRELAKAISSANIHQQVNRETSVQTVIHRVSCGLLK